MRGPEGQGAAIDAHDAVFRFNDAPTRGYEAHVGSRTTVRLQNLDLCGFAEHANETCVAYTAEKGHTCKRQLLRREQTGSCRLSASGRVLRPSLRETKYIHRYWRVNLPPGMKDAACNPRCGSKLSAGYYGILLAMNLCGKVSVYGFGGSKTKEDAHYFPKPSAGWDRKDWALRHHLKFERWCVNALAQGLVPRVEVVGWRE